MIPQNKDDLIQRILEDLGYPVIKVNVAQQQLDNAVDDAIAYWQQYHHEAQDRSFLKVVLTADMLAENKIPMPPSVFSVLSIVDPRASGSNAGWMSYEFEMTRDAIYDSIRPGGGGFSNSMSTYVMTKQYLSDIKGLINAPIPFDFRMYKGDLYILSNLGSIFKEGDTILIEVMGFLYKESYNIWGDEALRKLATAYAKKYWGMNLKKFSGVALPGGTLLNGDAIYQDALQDIEKYEQYIFGLQEPTSIVLL